MKLIEFSTRRPVSVFIFAVAAVVFGVVAFQRLATDLLPDIAYPSLTVRTDYPGAAPLEVESLVTRPIEDVVGVVNNVVRVTSSSRADLSEVTLEFAWDTDMDLASLDVRERLDVLRLPDDAERPVLLRYDPSLDPIVRIAITGGESAQGGAGAPAGGSDLARLRRLAEDEAQRRLERLDGVAAVEISGGLEEEIHIEVDERHLSNLGLSVDQVVSRIAAENINLTGGRLQEGQTEYLVRTLNEYLRPEELRDIVIDSSAGAVVRLKDVARVVRAAKEREIITRVDGRESVEAAIFKEGGTNTVTVSDTVRASLEALETRLQQLDPSLKLTILTDQARYIRQSVREVLQTAVYGGILAILILFLFLKSLRTTLIIGVAIPISVVATFFLMYTSGISLNIMSLGGITLGVGLLVDNAIVVLEAIQRRREEGLEPRQAAEEGASEVAQAVIASTLTTICVFVPIVFVQGVAAQLFSDQALTVAFSLVVSLIVALTVIPMLASREFGEGEPDRGEPEIERGRVGQALQQGFFAPLRRVAFAVSVALMRLLKGLSGALATVGSALVAIPLRLFHGGFDALAAVYGRLLDRALAHPLLAVLVALGLLLGSLQLYPRLGRELIPELVQGEFFVDVELPPGTRLEVTDGRLDQVERAAMQLPGVERVYAIAGSSTQQGGGVEEARENVGQLSIVVTPPATQESEEALMGQLRTVLDRQGEAFSYRFGRPSYFSFRTPIELEIHGYNLELLSRLADRLVAEMEQIPGLTDVKSSTEGGNPELRIKFQRERLAAYGLTVQEVADRVRAKVLGEVATDLNRQDRQIDVRVRVEEGFRDSVEDLAQLSIAQRGKTSIPLSAVAEVTEAEGPADIRRSDGDRAAVITANLVGRDLESAAADITRAVEAMDLPRGFTWVLGGQYQEMQTSFDSMRLAILLAIFMVYLVMASQFESLIHPFVILFSVPFSLIGVLLTLYLFDVTLSVVALIGVILLAGIVVNNAIILVDYTNRLRRQEGMAKLAALKQAGRVRLRPILMTTATTVLGLFPMALGLGEGSELRTPMALVVIGGLLTSTLLTLVIIPAVYALVDRGE
jgi:hydrophobic/amphiphilic exporter-1 (mainly G- bacteria), HAE1 family